MALAVMMLPVVTRAAQEVVDHRSGVAPRGGSGAGSPQWRVLLRVVLPTARVGLMTAVILGVARIAGETAPVLFNAGGNASTIGTRSAGNRTIYRSASINLIFQPGVNVNRDAWGVSFVLVLLVLLLFILARLVGSAKPGRHLIPRRRHSS